MIESDVTLRARMKRAWLLGWLATITSALVLAAGLVNPSPEIALTLAVTSFAATLNFRLHTRLKRLLRRRREVGDKATLTA
jgi:hypothetical protein